MYLAIALLCWAVVPGSFCYENIHEYMSPEELRLVFHTDADNIPEYEVVKLHMDDRLHKRALPARSRFRLRAFGEDINAWLHPSDSILAGVDTPVYYAKYSAHAPEGVEFRRQHGLMGMVGRMFEDPAMTAAFVIGREHSGRTRVNGYVGSRRLAIRSLPERVVNEYNRRRRAIDDPENPQYSPYHVVIKMNATFKEHYSHSPMNETRFRERLSRSVGSAVPWILYPEILVVVDNSVYKAFRTRQGYDTYRLLEYLLAFWNGVDLEYRSIETPRFRFHISAIVLAVDHYATPYIARNMFNAVTVDINKSTQEAKKFFYGVKNSFPLHSYDVATTMTRLKLGQNANILGQAWVGSACQKDNVKKTFDAVTIYRDNGAFCGVHTVAHELGHIFGANHDFDKCTWTDGFMMAPVPWHTTNTSDFSRCSLKDMQIRLKEDQLTCLYNRPRQAGKNLPKLMPGRMKNLEAQCKSLASGSSCQDKHPEHNVCTNMFCFDKNGECNELGSVALDGTECGTKNKFCLHHRCVSL